MKSKALKKLCLAIVAPTISFLPISVVACKNKTVEQVSVTLVVDGTQQIVKVNKGTYYSDSLFTKPTKEGYVFKHWKVNGQPITTDYQFNSNVTLEAYFEVTQLTITCTVDSLVVQTKVIDYGTTYTEGLFDTPTKVGYNFLNWKTSDNKPITTGYTFKKSETISAEFELADPVTISCYSGDSLLFSKVIAKNTNYSLSLFQEPAESGKQFKYWQFDNETKVTDQTKFDSDCSIYAVYEDIPAAEEYVTSLNEQKVLTDNDYLWESNFTYLDEYEGEYYLNQHYSVNSDPIDFGCSAFNKDKWVGRNFDWTYSTAPQMVVHTTATESRHASVGVSYCPGLTKDTLSDPTKIQNIKTMPFMTLDGINDQGLCAVLNEVPATDYGHNKGDGSDKPRMNEFRVIRYILDHAATLEDVQNILNNYNIYGPSSSYINENHIMVVDKNRKCGVIEFEQKSNSSYYKTPKLYIKDDAEVYFKGIMTNFTLTGYKGDCKTWNSEESSIQNHPEGCERYNLLDDALYGTSPDPLTSLDDVLDIMAKVYYSKTYSIELVDDSPDFWFSEYYWVGNKTTAHKRSTYYSDWNYYKQKYDAYVRGTDFWITRCSNAYDLDAKEFKMVWEEKTKTKVFTIAR